MRLYDIPRGSKILLPISKGDGPTAMLMCTFHHIDGMYSYVTTPDGSVVHLSATYPLKKVRDHYERDTNDV